MRWVVLTCVAWIACAACAPQPTPPPAPPSAAPDSSELVRLAEEALDRGELEVARKRFERVLARDPRSRRARAGLARIDLARGDPAAARARYESALAQGPASVEVLVGLAEVERVTGDADAASALLTRALALDPTRSDAHEKLAEITGPAPTAPLASVNLAVARAEAHPYDPRALFEAGRQLANAQQVEMAVALLEKAVWLSDLDPPAAQAAARLLARLDPAWRERRLVPVHVYADERVRAWPGWRFQLRTLWLSTSTSLDGILQTRFVPHTIAACSTEGSPVALEAIHLACLRSVERPARRDLVSAFTGRSRPRRPGIWKEGIAEFAGRRLSVRIEPEAGQSRVLAHEILHIYGGVHVVDEIESLMNPSGGSLRLDRANYRIVRALRGRHFESGGFERNILPWIDLDETIAAYEAALAVNLTYRKLGLDEAIRSRSLSRYEAARRAKQAQSLDPHLADVSSTLASLKLADQRGAEAVALLEVAARLYGSGTRQGREASERAELLRERLRERYGDR